MVSATLRVGTGFIPRSKGTPTSVHPIGSPSPHSQAWRDRLVSPSPPPASPSRPSGRSL